jgi:hypothetical protein
MTTPTVNDATFDLLTAQLAEHNAAEPRGRGSRKRHDLWLAAKRGILSQLADAPICWGNFHDATRAVFHQIPFEAIGNRQPDFVSPSGSMYWRTATGVYRLADHWGIGIRRCDWYLRTFAGEKGDGPALGFCAYDHFRRDVYEVARYFMLAPDGSETLCSAAAFVRKGYTLRKEVIVASIRHNYASCLANQL